MQHFNIWIEGAGAADGVYRDVKATEVDVAIKRVLGGAHADRLKFATVGKNRVKLAKDQVIKITVKRWH